MKNISPKFAYDDDGNKVAVLLTAKEFDTLVEELEDFEDYLIVKDWQKRKHSEKTIPMEQVKKELLGKS